MDIFRGILFFRDIDEQMLKYTFQSLGLLLIPGFLEEKGSAYFSRHTDCLALSSVLVSASLFM